MYEIPDNSFQLLVRANGCAAVTLLIFTSYDNAEAALKELNTTGMVQPANGFTASRLYARNDTKEQIS